MAGWAGFTDEDLRQIKQSSSPGGPAQGHNMAQKQAMMRNKKLQQQQRDLLARQRAQEFAHGSDQELPASQRLAPPNPPKSGHRGEPGGYPDKTDSKENTPPGARDERSQSTAGNATTGDKHSESTVSDNASENGPAVEEIKELDEKEALSLELSRVELFRRQQQKMEEENKQRRQLLADAIKQRSRMAKAEAEKLTKVQKELNHLDSLLTADVSIIRDRIEAASIEFLQAQKRYERAEKEFVEAKLALAEKSDVKESLTEHLYTIIQQNEVRKAERLASLMKELGLAADDCPAAPSFPPLLSFSPINTLHRPAFPPSSPTSPQSTSLPAADSVHSTSASEGSTAPTQQADSTPSQTNAGSQVPQTGERTDGEGEGSNTSGSQKEQIPVTDSGEKKLPPSSADEVLAQNTQSKQAEDSSCSSVTQESQDGGASVEQQQKS